jgi:hypothetical protein
MKRGSFCWVSVTWPNCADVMVVFGLPLDRGEQHRRRAQFVRPWILIVLKNGMSRFSGYPVDAFEPRAGRVERFSGRMQAGCSLARAA